MSWKAVELQVALPRTQDAGQLQDQLQQRGQLMQDRLQDEHIHELNRKRKAVIEANNSENVLVDKDGANSNELFDKGESSTDKGNKQTDIDHPYLGKQIDFSG
ncbi:hypothetical protein [Halalkalibacillus halophilus]|uniref:hypothetical protein n=1 Tax=Halalkalibacillus halophilus TaxID=392827 RepID=UPI00040CB9E4|nr:hypothetical protein [Halalkalibacillus halophilus]